MNIRIILLLSVLLGAMSVSAIENVRVDAALASLDEVLERRDDFIRQRQARIDTLVASIGRLGASPQIYMDIAEAYTGFNNDSALAYLDRGKALAAGTDRYLFQWKSAAIMPLSGFFESALRNFQSIPEDSVPANLLSSYYDSGRRMHRYISHFFSHYPRISEPNRESALKLQRKLLDVLPPDSPAYRFNMAEYNFINGNISMAEVLLQDVLDYEPEASNYRAMAAHHLATIARDRGDTNAYRYYLAMAAETDVRTATLDVVALQELGNYVFAAGEQQRAHNYLATALDNAVQSAAPMRSVDASNCLPIIENVHMAQSESWKKTLRLAAVLLALVVAALIVMLIVLRHETHRLKVMEAGLRDANNAKEVYIGQFLQLCSIYMDKLNRFCNIATRKLASGQADELYQLTKSGKFVEEQSREFYEVFDRAFLNIYPDFVAGVNRLLRPECRIELTQGEQLNTDLRILAFMRLGIEESARIAQVLNYSLNTIYAYRNRLRSRAIDKENFEKNIMDIGR